MDVSQNLALVVRPYELRLQIVCPVSNLIQLCRGSAPRFVVGRFSNFGLHFREVHDN